MPGTAFGLHGSARLSARNDVPRARRSGRPLETASCHRSAQTAGTGGGSLEPLSPRQRAWRGSHESRIRAAVRAHGTRPLVSRGLQLLGARYGEYGSPRALRHGRAEGALARAASGRDVSFLLPHDPAPTPTL